MVGGTVPYCMPGGCGFETSQTTANVKHTTVFWTMHAVCTLLKHTMQQPARPPAWSQHPAGQGRHERGPAADENHTQPRNIQQARPRIQRGAEYPHTFSNGYIFYRDGRERHGVHRGAWRERHGEGHEHARRPNQTATPCAPASCCTRASCCSPLQQGQLGRHGRWRSAYPH